VTMTFKEVAARLTGLSVPIFGVSWAALEPDVTKARRVLTFLEDRRVLYSPYEIEVPDHCVHSVLDIRRFLSHELEQSPLDSDLTASLRAMRASCRRFLEHDKRDQARPVSFPSFFTSTEGWLFTQALGELRGVFGIHVGKLSVMYGIDIEDELARILPPLDEG